MIYVAYCDNTGRITSIDTGPAVVFKNNPFCVRITKDQSKTVIATHHIENGALVPGVIADPNTPDMAEIRRNRDMLLIGAGQRLTEYMLPDSFPLLSEKAKQNRINTLIKYRQKLRDVTLQDRRDIVWPEFPL